MRITNKHLEYQVELLNRLENKPLQAYTKLPEGNIPRFKANIGNYHIGEAYGKVQLLQMENEHGGVQSHTALLTKRELYEVLRALVSVTNARSFV